MKKINTAAEVLKEFNLRGLAISSWAVGCGFPPSLVYRVLKSDKVPQRGQSHDIAILLGMKEGIISPTRLHERHKTHTAWIQEQMGG